MKKCPICHKMNDEDSAICTVCGYIFDAKSLQNDVESVTTDDDQVMKKCPICHKMNEEDCAVCTVCGFVFDADKLNETRQQSDESSPMAKKGERRCLFCGTLIKDDSNECPVCGLEYGKKEPDHFNNVPTNEIPKDDRLTTVYLLSFPKKELLYISMAAPILGFLLYGAWAMIACVFVFGIVQVLCGIYFGASMGQTNQETIKVSEIDKYVESENKKRNIIQLLCVVILVLNCYPFLATNWDLMFALGKDTYEGGVVVTLLVIVLWVFWIFIMTGIPKPSVEMNSKMLKESGMTVEDQREIEKLKKKEIEQLKIKKYGEGYISLGYDIFVNDNTKKIFIGTNIYDFKDILDFSVKDNSVTIHSASTSTAKTNTGSMIGRAAVGKVLFGNVGAVIGGATASKIIEHSETKSTVSHDYSVIITVNNIASPTEIIRLRKNETALNKIVATLTIILKGN